MIILIRHAQSEGNKNREIHQLIPDHRVKLTDDGWVQVMLPSVFLDQHSSSEAVIN
jgi:broad specificity phosphatase PhoE